MNGNRIKSDYTGLELAVIGMSCRFPEANSKEEFWENLQKGVESIHFLTGEELETSNTQNSLIDNPNFIPARGTLANPEYFDSSFFGYKPMEVEMMDPQIRFFYECCWETLEDSGYNPESYEGLIGIYAGATNHREWELKGILNERIRELGYFARNHLIDRDFLSTRIAYKLNLRGPAVTVKTACSTGLVAVDLACRALLTGQCEIALAGASSMNLKPPGYIYEEGMIESADGHVRSFDAASRGVIFSDGVGVVVIKRLKTALRDRDFIYAVIKGTAVNNDGARKGAYEAPCAEGQEEVIRTAIHMSEVEPESITYVETHGTGTVIGDPIEIEGLKGAFNTEKKGYCAIGSVKSNFGHTDTTAGIAGFIKTVLALKHRMIPPSLHYTEPNPKIDFENSPFYVNNTLKEWKNDKYPLRAGVSSFGVGGTNAHAVLEEAPPPEPTSPSRNLQLIMVSARTASALQKTTENLLNHLNKNPGISTADVAYTLQQGRKTFKFRNMWLVNPTSLDFDMPHTSTAREKNHLVFMFPGQGAQYVNMGRDLYENEPVFQQAMNHCFEILKTTMGCDVKEILYPHPECRGGSPYPPQDRVGPPGQSSGNSPLERGAPHGRGVSLDINQTQITQPVIFTIEYAMAKLLMHWGLKPYAMIGHSIGEYTAACLSGVFSLEHALQLVVMRGKLMQQMPPGAMLSVTLPEPELMPILQQNRQLSLAAVNAPALCVVSGPHQAVDSLEKQLQQKDIRSQRLHTSHAFHSHMVDPILKQFRQAVNEISLEKPQLPYISNVSARWITVEQALNPGYWEEHLRTTVRFRDGLTPLLNDPHSIFIELGPGRSLATFVQKHHNKKDEHIVLNLLKHPKEDSQDNYYLLNKIGQLWLYGVNIDWQGFYSHEKRQRVSLPTYPFERQLYQLEEVLHLLSGEIGATKKKSLAARIKKKPDLEEWFYIPSWKRAPVPVPAREPEKPVNWLIFIDEKNSKNGLVGLELLDLLKRGHPEDHFTIVEIGADFGTAHPGSGDLGFTVNPRQENDYQELIAGLKKQERIPQRVIHLWNVAAGETEVPGEDWTENYEMHEYIGFYSLIFLAKAIGREGIGEKIRIIVVTDNMQEVTGEETLCPPRAMVLGPVRVIPVENHNLHCSSIDVIFPRAGSGKEKTLLDQLVVEFMAETTESVIAYRNHYRWVQSFEPVSLAAPARAASPAPTGEKMPVMRDGGVYLITGGLGGIGLELACHLAKQVKAKFILFSRSPLPKKQEWQNWLDTHNYHDKTSTRIRKIRELESAETGAEIVVASADVSDYQQMQAIVTREEKKWGKINGVIHAAGVLGGGVVQLKTPGIADKVLAPKVQGTLVLDKILKHHPLDFFILFSSINSVVPMFGQVDYFSANAFLDAFAHYKNTQHGILTVSINWDTWQQVGMAAEAFKQLEKRFVGSSSPHINHPLFDRYLHEDQEQAIFVTHFNLHRHWVLNEHKITGSGKGLAPGVTYLEMARQALEIYTGININRNNHMVEISDIYFLNPLIVAEGEERETQLILKKQTENHDSIYDFLVRSRTGTGETNWEKHAQGKIRWKEKKQETIHDIDKIAGEWVNTHLDFSQLPREERKHDNRGNLLSFGPRWRCTRRKQLGEKQGLAFLDLDKKFSRELEFFKLHPALLDSSTGFLFSQVGKDAYIPFAYKRLTMKAPLPPKIYSYCRVIESGETRHKESLKFDVTIMDERGKELVDIKEFTMLQVSEQIKSKVKEKETSTINLDMKPRTWDQEENEFLKNGILSSEGKEVFNRILYGVSAVPTPLSQVVVSTTDLLTRIEHRGLSPLVLEKQQAASDQTSAWANAPHTLQARPAISSVYVAPKTETEKKIAGIWQRLLGIKQVGINDDFFELGGDSLNVVQLNNQLKKVFNRDIPVAVMFKYLTIQSFVQYLEKGEIEEIAEEEEADRSDELKKSKDRLKIRSKRR